MDISDGDVRNETSYFNKEELLQCVNYDCINVDSDEDDAKSEPGVTPFQRMASKMISLTEDGKVKKRVCYLYLFVIFISFVLCCVESRKPMIQL